MPLTVITTSATFNLKNGGGYIRNLLLTAPGTSWTLQINDGPDTAGNVVALFGKTPFTIPASNFAAAVQLLQQLWFSRGLQIVTAGATPGELEVDWI